MRLLIALISFPKAVYLYAIFKISTWLLKLRNQPVGIIIYPDKRLKRVAEIVDFDKMNRKQRLKVVRKMSIALGRQTYGSHLGISAPQIGINLRVMVIRGNVMFNPEWKSSVAKNLGVEGCYSIPGKIYKVWRPEYGWAKWTNIDGKPFEDKLRGIPAIIFQHKLDHLNGVCCAEIGEETKLEVNDGRTPIPENINKK
jgi:peptide deformylase